MIYHLTFLLGTTSIHNDTKGRAMSNHNTLNIFNCSTPILRAETFNINVCTIQRTKNNPAAAANGMLNTGYRMPIKSTTA